MCFCGVKCRRGCTGTLEREWNDDDELKKNCFRIVDSTVLKFSIIGKILTTVRGENPLHDSLPLQKGGRVKGYGGGFKV